MIYQIPCHFILLIIWKERLTDNQNFIFDVIVLNPFIMSFLLVYFILLPISSILAQTNPPDGEETKVAVDGKIYSALITPDGDTLILTDLDGLQITALRKFGSDDEYKKYMRFRNYAQIVFPYAKEAIRIFRELELSLIHISEPTRPY